MTSRPHRNGEDDSNGGDNASPVRFVERLISLLEDRQQLTADMRILLEEAKAAGHTPAAIRKVATEAFRLRQETAEQTGKREALEDEMDRIRAALGAFADTPLGEAAVNHAAS